MGAQPKTRLIRVNIDTWRKLMDKKKENPEDTFDDIIKKELNKKGK